MSLRRLSVLFTMCLFATQASAQSLGSLLQRSEAFTAPGRLFSVVLPAGWGFYPNSARSSFAEFRHSDLGPDAVLLVRQSKIAPGASPRHLMLLALEQTLSKLPGFRELGRRQLSVAGQPAFAVSGVYFQQGNRQFPRAFEEVYVVREDDCFTLRFDCFEPAFLGLAASVNGFYDSFTIRPSVGAAAPRSPSGVNGGIEGASPDLLPF